MMNKKGISQAVGFVLIIALTIGLAVFVGSWLKTRSEQTSEDIASDLEKTTKCDDTTLRAYANCTNICKWDGTCGFSIPEGCGIFEGNKADCLLNWEICHWVDPDTCENGFDDDQNLCNTYLDPDRCNDSPACKWQDTACVWDGDNWPDGRDCTGYDDEECGNRAGGYIGSIDFVNKGLFSIVGLKCNGVDVSFNLLPDEEKKEQDLNKCVAVTRVLIVPFVDVSSGGTFGCVTKKVTLEC